jgi:hypothetical protein
LEEEESSDDDEENDSDVSKIGTNISFLNNKTRLFEGTF